MFGFFTIFAGYIFTGGQYVRGGIGTLYSALQQVW